MATIVSVLGIVMIGGLGLLRIGVSYHEIRRRSIERWEIARQFLYGLSYVVLAVSFATGMFTGLDAWALVGVGAFVVSMFAASLFDVVHHWHSIRAAPSDIGSPAAWRGEVPPSRSR